MSQNPYEATDLGDEVKVVLSGTREDLRKVASAQKGVMLCLLINIALLFGVNFAPGGLRPIIGGVMLIAGLASAVFVFLLASRTYNIGIAILLLVVQHHPLVWACWFS